MFYISQKFERFCVNRAACIAILIVTASSCSSELDDKVVEHKADSASITKSDDVTSKIDNAMSVQGLALMMREKPKADGSEQLPRFRVAAETGISENGVDYTLTNPRALVYDDEGEEIALTADTGEFNQKSERARLKDNVIVEAGNLKFMANSVTWNNELGMAIANNGVTLKSETVNLTADYLSLEPSTNEFTMKQVSGTIRWEE